ncbi:MAG TPA: SOS response-associated peptidase [Bacillales bacterium]|nr:SOS response-associated peptidase [Bacillales bacterium]
MCGRYTLFTNPILLGKRFNLINLDKIIIRPRYNIAPSQDVVAVISDGRENRAGMLKWGLVPVWAKDPKIGYKMINARAETVHEKPSYARLLKRRRCLIPADGFYEWKKIGSRKQPFHIRLKDGEPFAFAGLWDRWEREGEIIQSCTIITTEPNELMKDIHNRMPVILKKEHESAWLDPEMTDSNWIKTLLEPYPEDKMRAEEVSAAVGSPKNDDESLIEPLN